MQIVPFVTRHVRGEGDHAPFDWSGFKASVNAKPASDLTFDLLRSTRMTFGDATWDKVSRDISGSLTKDSSFSACGVKLKEALEEMCTDLQEAKRRGWAAFSKSATTKKSSWELRFLLTLSFPKPRNALNVLVATVKLEADIETEVLWEGLKRTFFAKSGCQHRCDGA